MLHKALIDIRQAIDAHEMIPEGESLVLVGVSGGADSVLLFELLIGLELSQKLHVLHLNHGLRGDESDGDESFVKELGESRGVPVTTRKIDVLLMARDKRIGIEEAGRKARLDFFFEAGCALGSSTIALGHHRDDMVETVLFRLLRGTGMRGVAKAVSPVVMFRHLKKEYRIIRPLCDFSKSRILSVLSDKKTGYREDRTNADKSYLRNKIRHDLIPYLKKEYHNAADKNLFRFAGILKDEYENLIETRKDRIKKACRFKDGCIEIDILELLKSNDSEICGIIRLSVFEAFEHVESLSGNHLAEIIKQIHSRKPSSSVKLPCGLTSKRVYNMLVISGQGEKPIQTGFSHKFSLSVREVFVPEVKMVLRFDILKDMGGVLEEAVKDEPMVAYLDADTLSESLVVRSRMPGDRFCPLGSSKEGKLKTFFINQKISRWERTCIPLLVSEGKIVWAVGVRISENAKIAAATKSVVKITASYISSKNILSG